MTRPVGCWPQPAAPIGPRNRRLAADPPRATFDNGLNLKRHNLKRRGLSGGCGLGHDLERSGFVICLRQRRPPLSCSRRASRARHMHRESSYFQGVFSDFFSCVGRPRSFFIVLCCGRFLHCHCVCAVSYAFGKYLSAHRLQRALLPPRRGTSLRLTLELERG